MGSGSSKDASSSGGARKARARMARVFSSPCFGSHSDPFREQKQQIKRSRAVTCTAEVNSESVGGNHGSCQKNQRAQGGMPALTSADGEQSEEDQDDTVQNHLGVISSSSSGTLPSINQSTSSASRMRSRFGFIPDGIGFKLNKAVSLGSSAAHSLFSAGFPITRGNGGGSDRSLDGNGTQDYAAVGTGSSQNVIRANVRAESTTTPTACRNRVGIENSEVGHSFRRHGTQEPLDGNVRFSRTLSVGRFRDRVLRRTPFSEGLFTPALLDVSSVHSTQQASARRILSGTRRPTSSSTTITESHSDSLGSRLYRSASSMDRNEGNSSETLQHREASNRDVLEHTSAFLERRRRIRSQVRALQRLGSRFDNLSDHDRSCILSGQHRTGRCTCTTGNRAGNSDDHASTGASISRIVMLAEALFEVLDEIHQQSVVLASRPSFSSIGSVPAPEEVVECLPVKVYIKAKHQIDEAAQCYVCLVEYEEGDRLRILPCNHEFHLTCIDKWLKEIHRVCPLCRGDVCRSDASNSGKLS
ncbi:uncharacterized protein [Typha angustifolia]|uniref:uncharacterized protein isoform X2 n=1 Tax=Typha angustifolia TaxID=59011 RepID=UPI003C305924